MDYQNTLKYLYDKVPMFQEVGNKAYKPGLQTTETLDAHFGHPHKEFRTIHIAGTNGKGTCSHTIASVLQAAGYRVGLFTSPHLIDFRERIRVNGEMISEEYVTRFVEKERPFFEPLRPSFFELTTAMAFRYFADQHVDVAVIEVGMGGRLDCTNIINPDLCVITNIGFDHMQYLGNTLGKIAKEKAGIIKEKTPVIIGRAAGEVKRAFNLKAKEMDAPIIYAEKLKGNHPFQFVPYDTLLKLKAKLEEVMQDKTIDFLSPEDSLHAIDRLIDKKKDAIAFIGNEFPFGLYFELSGLYQEENAVTILTALFNLEKIDYYKLSPKDYIKGFSTVCEATGLMGRWQKLQSNPDLICDTGHNVDGIQYICTQLKYIHENLHKNLHIVFGMCNDKDINSVLHLLPKDATYYFTKATVKRAMPEDELMAMAKEIGLKGNSYPSVVEAVKAAQKNCPPEDFIFVGGSSFIVADLLANRDALDLH